jgi:hypothetical protein
LVRKLREEERNGKINPYDKEGEFPENTAKLWEGEDGRTVKG